MVTTDFRLRRSGRRGARGFTLVETLVTVILMVVVFAFLATIFSRASVIHQVVRRGGDAENLGASFMNTFLYGPGIERHQGLIGTPQVFLPAAGEIDPVDDDPPEEHLSRYLAFRTTDGNELVVYRLGSGDERSVLRSRQTETVHDFTNPDFFVDIRPAWAREQEVELREGSIFEYLKQDFSPVSVADIQQDPLSISWVRIRLVLRSALQPEEESVVVERLVRIRNIPPPF